MKNAKTEIDTENPSKHPQPAHILASFVKQNLIVNRRFTNGTKKVYKSHSVKKGLCKIFPIQILAQKGVTKMKHPHIHPISTRTKKVYKDNKCRKNDLIIYFFINYVQKA